MLPSANGVRRCRCNLLRSALPAIFAGIDASVDDVGQVRSGINDRSGRNVAGLVFPRPSEIPDLRVHCGAKSVLTWPNDHGGQKSRQSHNNNEILSHQ